MRTAHFPGTVISQANLGDLEEYREDNTTNSYPMHNCTRSEGTESCTGAFDQVDYSSDTPTAQLVSLLLETHSRDGQAAALLSLRDPWSWVSSRNNHHGQHEKSDLRPIDDWMRVR